MIRTFPVVLSVLLGCGACEGTRRLSIADGGPVDAGEEEDVLSCGADIVLLVDEGGRGMDVVQSDLAARLPQFVADLARAGVDARIAVSRSWSYLNTGTEANPCPSTLDGIEFFSRASGAPGCPEEVFEEGAPAWVDASDPAAGEALSCVATRRAECRISTPFHVATVLLEECRAEDSHYLLDSCVGFFREDALVTLVVVSNQDDCEPPGGRDEWPVRTEPNPESFFAAEADSPNWGPAGSSYEPCVWRFGELRPVPDLLEALAAKVGKPFLLAVVGGPDRAPQAIPTPDDPSDVEVVPGCTSDLGNVWPAPRLHDAVERLGERASIQDLCEGGEAVQRTLDEVVQSVLAWQDPKCFRR